MNNNTEKINDTPSLMKNKYQGDQGSPKISTRKKVLEKGQCSRHLAFYRFDGDAQLFGNLPVRQSTMPAQQKDLFPFWGECLQSLLID